MLNDSAAGKYFIGNTVVAPERRDRFRALTRADTYRNLKTSEPRVGEEGVYTVELTEAEVRDLERNRPSNLRYVQKVGPAPQPCVDQQVPGDSDLRGHRADKLFEWGFTGQGIDVGVIDSGLGSGVASKFNIKAIRAMDGGTAYYGFHGSCVASVAVPAQARLVHACALPDGAPRFDGSHWIAGLYWMVDEVGVHCVNMSFGSYEVAQAERDVIAHALDRGVVLFAASGNDGSTSPFYPSSTDGVERVGALDKASGWRRASFSNYGGVDIWMNGVQVVCYGPGGEITTANGTSLATPIATYLFAALMTKGVDSIGPENVLKALKDGGITREGGKIGQGEAGAYAMRNYCRDTA